MGFFFWLLCAILVVALVLLLFPFSFRMEFEVGERGARALFFFFKKKIYEAKKSWRDEESRAEQRAVSEPAKDAVAKHPEETTTEKMTVPAKEDAGCSADSPTMSHPEQNEEEPKDFAEPAVEKAAEPKAEAEPIAEKSIEPAKEDASETPAADDEKPAKKQKKEKRKLTDREFWTIVLTPELDGRAFRYLKNIFATSMSLFRVKFIDCFVEGIRMEYVDMGYAAALNAFLKTYPYVGAWDFRMDWCYDKELRAQGTITASINLLRIICFTLKMALYAGILFLSFWRRRARVLKTNELPELGFIRRKIIDFIVEE